MKEKIKKILGNNKEIYTNYKATFILIIINTILSVFLYEEYDYNEFLTALFLSNIFFFVVETFIKDNKIKIPCLLGSILLSALANHILYDTVNTPRVPLFVIGIYLTSFLVSLYKISKQEKDFNIYFLKVFSNGIILAIASFVLEIGILFLTLITEELLFPDLSIDLLFKMEIIFFGLFIVPGILLCILNTKSEPLKLIKVLSGYILLPIVLLSELIVYIYFIKTIITNDVPSNMIFGIITALFVIAIPTHLLISNYKDKSLFIKKNVEDLPYSYIPLILMAMYALYLRIFEYGITISRYFGVIAIALEIIFTIYVLEKKQAKMHKLILVCACLSILSLTIPYINCVSISRTSQLKRLTSIYKKDTVYDNLTKDEKDMVYDSYFYLTNELSADDYIPDYIDKTKVIKNYVDYNYNNSNNYISYYNNDKLVPISGYNYISVLNINKYNNLIPKMQFDEIVPYRSESDLSEKLQDSFKDYLYILMSDGEVGNPQITLDDNHAIYLIELHLSYNKDTQNIYSLYVSGYLLER